MSQNTRTSRFVQNTLSTAAYQLTAMLMGFVTPRLIMLYYGSQVNGLIESVTEFLTAFRLVEAGLASAAVVSLYKPLAHHDDDATSRIVTAARQYYNKAGFLFVGITIAFSLLYPLFIPIESMSDASVSLLIIAMGISGSLEFFTLSRYRVLLTADQRTFMVSLASMASLLVSTALIVVCSYLQVNIIVMRLGASLTLVLRATILHAYVRKQYPTINAQHPKPDKKPLALRWDAMYQQFTTAFHQVAGGSMITLIVRDVTMNSVYSTYHMVTLGLWSVLKMATTGIYSSFGNLLVDGKEKKFQVAYRDFEYLYLAASTILFSCAAVLIVPFVVLYTDKIHDANYFAPAIGLMIVLETMTDHGKMPMDLMITAAGVFRETRHHCTAQLITSIVMGLGLGLWGMQISVTMAICGILAGVICGNILRTALHLWFIPKHVTHLPWAQSFWRIVRMLLEIAVIAVPFLLFFPLRINGFFKWISLAVPLLIYATTVTLGFGWFFDRESLLSLFGRVRYMFQRGR